MSGAFITFEGCEGSGKSTQSERVYQALIKNGYPALLTREPGGTKISDRIRELLLARNEDGSFNNMTANTELMLYLASRAQHVEELIFPALKAGKIVLCDRYFDATAAYQGYGRGLDFGFLKLVNDFITQKLNPDLTILMDISPDVGLERSRKIKKNFAKEGELDRMESQSLKFHAAVREGYLSIARQEPDRVVVFDGVKPLEQNFEQILERIMTHLQKNAISGHNRPRPS